MGGFELTLAGMPVKMTAGPHAHQILEQIDGERSIAEIAQRMRDTLPAKEFNDELRRLFDTLNSMNFLLLRS